jgi:hypothetical protein
VGNKSRKCFSGPPNSVVFEGTNNKFRFPRVRTSPPPLVPSTRFSHLMR